MAGKEPETARISGDWKVVSEKGKRDTWGNPRLYPAWVMAIFFRFIVQHTGSKSYKDIALAAFLLRSFGAAPPA
jgi:hypothetical protein